MNENAHILIVEDDPNFGKMLSRLLINHEYEVDLSVGGDSGFSKFKRNYHDLCILDVMLPDRDGFKLATDIRKVDKYVPIIFLTAKGEKRDFIKGYGTGADDYVTKPCDPELLLLKVNAILQRRVPKVEYGNDVHLGKLIFVPSERMLKSEKTKFKLTPKETALLQLLVNRKNSLLPRGEALLKIWKKEDYFTTRSMDVYIAKLRKKLSEEKRISIENVHGTGFIFHFDD